MALPTGRCEAATSRPPAVWEPFRELDELERRTTDLMQSVWSGLRAGDAQPWVPAVGLEKTDDAWIVLADGVLTVRVSKPEQARPRHVEVQAREA
jgi:hypothetical protein